MVEVRRDRGREFQIIGVATLQLRAPNDVRTNGAERRLVLERTILEKWPPFWIFRWLVGQICLVYLMESSCLFWCLYHQVHVLSTIRPTNTSLRMRRVHGTPV